MTLALLGCTDLPHRVIFKEVSSESLTFVVMAVRRLRIEGATKWAGTRVLPDARALAATPRRPSIAFTRRPKRRELARAMHSSVYASKRRWRLRPTASPPE